MSKHHALFPKADGRRLLTYLFEPITAKIQFLGESNSVKILKGRAKTSNKIQGDTKRQQRYLKLKMLRR